MIELSNVKLILWDFDDTLCFHSNHKSDRDEFETEYNINVLTGKNVYKTCFFNSQIKAFMHFAKNKGIRQGLLSSTNCYIHMVNKQNWVAEYYGISLENYCVSSAHMKLGILIALAEANKLKRSEILFVDDSWDNLERAADNGFQACSPVEVIEYAEIL